MWLRISLLVYRYFPSVSTGSDTRKDFYGISFITLIRVPPPLFLVPKVSLPCIKTLTFHRDMARHSVSDSTEVEHGCLYQGVVHTESDLI